MVAGAVGHDKVILLLHTRQLTFISFTIKPHSSVKSHCLYFIYSKVIRGCCDVTESGLESTYFGALFPVG